MRFYSFGLNNLPVILLLPGTCCHWKANFANVIPLLKEDYHVVCASYDGFDETEQTEFTNMLDEVKKIEAYISEHYNGHIRAAYGCSLGGSFVGLLAARQNICIDYCILGSSDLDQASPFMAKLQTDILIPIIYPLICSGQFKSGILRKLMKKKEQEMPQYVSAFMKMFGGARPYVTKRSCRNQFYSDLVTPLPNKIDAGNTKIHIFFALKMGKKYRTRYEKHFAHPVIHEQNLQHEELLACYPQQWAHLVKSIIDIEQHT